MKLALDIMWLKIQTWVLDVQLWFVYRKMTKLLKELEK